MDYKPTTIQLSKQARTALRDFCKQYHFATYDAFVRYILNLPEGKRDVKKIRICTCPYCENPFPDTLIPKESKTMKCPECGKVMDI